MKNEKDTFIVDLWEKIFNLLSKISVFSFIKLIKKEITYSFVEKWVIFNTLFAFSSTLIVYYLGGYFVFVIWILMIYGSLRIFEIIIYQINVLLFDPSRAIKNGIKYRIKSPTRLVVLLIHNYFEIICWFSTIFISNLILNDMISDNWGYYLRINFLCISTFDTSYISESLSHFGKLSQFAFYETTVGFIITIISLARFIGLLPGVDSVEEI